MECFTQHVANICEVVLESGISKALDYLIPDALLSTVTTGVSVEVPLRNRKAYGFVTKIKRTQDVQNLRPLTKVVSQGPVVTAELFELALWMASYYYCPLGKVLKTMLPKGVRKNISLKTQYAVRRKKTRQELQEIVRSLREKAPLQAVVIDCMLQVKGSILLSELLEKTSAQSSSVKSLVEKGYLSLDTVRSDQMACQNAEYFKTKPKILSDEQEKALEGICQSIDKRVFSTHLLFGITGSGKTEVYLQAIDTALKAGLGVIMLVPEISLTPQTIQHFKSRFDEPIQALHHRLSDGQRLDSWEQIRSGRCKLVLGARSGIFCPMPNCGLIIVDEEHEMSYKQTDETPHYSARDVAVMRAKLTCCPVILGSATPSIESYQNAILGRYSLHELTKRPQTSVLPTIQLVDMKHEFAKAKGFTSFSELLLTKIDERRKKGEQTILFLNRRGYHSTISCTSCTKSMHCPHCEKSLTFHKETALLCCHLCGYSQKLPRVCPECKKQTLDKFSGVGTEKVEAMLHGIFPGISTIRIDRDTTRHKGRLEMLLQAFRSAKAEVLIGTQMIAKGLHFPQVTLVGVLNADSALQIPDFRAEESVYQLITQVAGRAGRAMSPGEVIIQTQLVEHDVMHQALKQDYKAFFDAQVAIRKTFYFPPFCKMVKFQFASKDEKKVLEYASLYHEALRNTLSDHFICHPCIASGHAKVKDFYRYQFLIRGPSIKDAIDAVMKVDTKVALPSTVYRSIDIDPLSTFF
jgi:primosomal protein N' (replication factor Y) (superfamily II helicase)